MLKNSSIKVKLLTTIIGSMILITIIMLFQSIISLKSTSSSIIEKSTSAAYKAKEEELQNYISLAYKIVESYHFKMTQGETEEEMKQEALNAVSKMKYGKNGYYWINDSNHVVLMHGTKASLAGKSLYNLHQMICHFL